MAIGERIRFFRILRGMTQKHLGMTVGFPEKSADVRLAQYENGSRSPKADLTAARSPRRTTTSGGTTTPTWTPLPFDRSSVRLRD